MNALLSSLVDDREFTDRSLAESAACLLLAPSGTGEVNDEDQNGPFPGIYEMEPTGIEPVTSCLQSRRSPN